MMNSTGRSAARPFCTRDKRHLLDVTSSSGRLPAHNALSRLRVVWQRQVKRHGGASRCDTTCGWLDAERRGETLPLGMVSVNLGRNLLVARPPHGNPPRSQQCDQYHRCRSQRELPALPSAPFPIPDYFSMARRTIPVLHIALYG
jgi:hypothetical protein